MKLYIALIFDYYLIDYIIYLNIIFMINYKILFHNIIKNYKK